METSVILCTRNRVDEVIRFSQSLYNQTRLPSEFIIVDSSDEPLNSNEKFIDFFKQRQEKICLHYFHSEAGLTKQRNIGVRQSSGAIIYFFDDDVILDPRYLQIMNKSFDDYPDYMGGMGTMINIGGYKETYTLSYIIKRFFLLQHNYGNGKFQKSGFPRHPYGTNQFKEVEVLGGGLTGYRKEVFKEFNFDENLTGYSFMEDVDFSRRVSYKYKLFYNPEAKLEHRVGRGGRGDIRENRKTYILNHRYLFFKNFFPRNKLYVIPHWWSILGLIIYSLIFESKESVRGYVDGLKESRKRRG